MISEFCKKNGIFLVVDAISSFLADDFDMNKLGVQVMITGSQKALACPPGVSVIVLSDEAVKRVEERDVKCIVQSCGRIVHNFMVQFEYENRATNRNLMR